MTSTLSISLKADANEHMEVTWKYDVKNVGGDAYSSPALRENRGDHVDLTGERNGDIYPASQLVSRPIRAAVETEGRCMALRHFPRMTKKETKSAKSDQTTK
jgi:hypothetical protein